MQVLIFGGRTYFRGYDKAGWKIQQGRSLFNLVISVENTLLCMFQRLCTYFQDTGVLIFGGVCTFGALQPTANFRKKMKGVLIYGVLRKPWFFQLMTQPWKAISAHEMKGESKVEVWSDQWEPHVSGNLIRIKELIVTSSECQIQIQHLF